MAAAKKVASKKAAKKTATKPAKVRASGNATKRITKHAKENPFKEGSAAAKKYDGLLTVMKKNPKATVGDVVAGSAMDSNLVRGCVKRGFITLSA